MAACEVAGRRNEPSPDVRAQRLARPVRSRDLSRPWSCRPRPSWPGREAEAITAIRGDRDRRSRRRGGSPRSPASKRAIRTRRYAAAPTPHRALRSARGMGREPAVPPGGNTHYSFPKTRCILRATAGGHGAARFHQRGVPNGRLDRRAGPMARPTRSEWWALCAHKGGPLGIVLGPS